MVKKIKKLLKNSKGFTLVELLAVIVILGIIAAIAVPSIGNIIENSREKAAEATVQQAIEAARIALAAGELKPGGTISAAEDATLPLQNYMDLNGIKTSNLQVSVGNDTPVVYTASGSFELEGTTYTIENGTPDNISVTTGD